MTCALRGFLVRPGARLSLRAGTRIAEPIAAARVWSLLRPGLGLWAGYHLSVAESPQDNPQAVADDQFDRDLITAIRSGNADAWGRLVESYQVRIFSICVRMVRDRELASDLTQDAFIKIIKGLDTFDERARLSTWVYRVTVNVCLSKLRSEKLRRHASLEAMASAGGRQSDGRGELGFAQHREPGAHLGIEHEEKREQMLSALDTLSDEHRAILTLRDGRGLEYEQIAEVLDIPVGTVRSRLFRARASLRQALEAQKTSGT